MTYKNPDIQIRLNSVLETIEPLELRQLVSNVFTRLSELLEYLDFLEGCLRSDELLPKSHLVLKFLNDKALDLVTYIETTVELDDSVTDALRTLFDSTNFAVKHEVGRVFGSGTGSVTQPEGELLTELTRAHGILRNCFQQSVISLALVFDSTITSMELFDDFRLKREQSMILLQALTILNDQARETEKVRDLDSYFALVEGLKMFRQGYMSYLNYSDWAEFESLADKIISARTEFELTEVIDQFVCYSDTLVGHVRLRAVFHEHEATVMEVA
jgi:hypothetical protein